MLSRTLIATCARVGALLTVSLSASLGAAALRADTVVPAGVIAADTAWTLAGSPYIVTGAVTVQGALGPTLTIEPGVVIRFTSTSSKLRIGYQQSGRLIADGNGPGGPATILFTSDEPPGSKARGQWAGIQFSSQTLADSILRNAVVEYGSSGAFSDDFAIQIATAANVSTTIEDVIIRESLRYGVEVGSGVLDISACSISSSTLYDVILNNSTAITGTIRDSTLTSFYYNGNSPAVTWTGNHFAGWGMPVSRVSLAGATSLSTANTFSPVAGAYLEIWNGTLTDDALWAPAPGPYRLLGVLDVGGTVGPTLTIAPGTELRMATGSTKIRVGYQQSGRLIADGNGPGGPATILFTSDEPPGSKARGQWAGIQFSSQTLAGSILRNAVVEYGSSGAFSDDFAIQIATAANLSMPLHDVTIRESTRHGVELASGRLDIVDSTVELSTLAGIVVYNGAQLSLSRSAVRQNAQEGINVSSGGTVTACGASIASNATGILTASSNIRVRGSNFSGNSSFGFRNTTTSQVDARGNYWGAASGPSSDLRACNTATGAGDKVSCYVDFTGVSSVPLDPLDPDGGCDFGRACSQAMSVVSFAPGDGTSQSVATAALGSPDASAVPLGLDGVLILRMSQDILDGPGDDFVVHENGVTEGALDENYKVEVSADGNTYSLTGTCTGDDCSFDLAPLGLGSARFVRITDLPPQEAGTMSPNLGADIDAVSALHCNEICNDRDDDGDSVPDEGCNDDGDLYCDESMSVEGPPTSCPQGGGDCDDQDANVNPGLNEIPGNIVDENCDRRTTQPLGTIQGYVRFADGTPVPATPPLLAVQAESLPPGFSKICQVAPTAMLDTSYWCDNLAAGCYTIRALFSPATGNLDVDFIPPVERVTPLPICINQAMYERRDIVFGNPAVLVHGWNSETEALNTWSAARDYLTQRGVPVFIVNTRNTPVTGLAGLHGCASYSANIDYLRAYLDELVLPNLRTVGRDLPRLRLVAHSMGGLISRQYLGRPVPEGTESRYDHRYISQVIELGTPNAGTVAPGKANFLTDVFKCNAYTLLSRPSVYLINRRFKSSRGVSYFYIAGEDNVNDPDCGGWWSGFEPNPEDLWVAEQSVFHRRVGTNTARNIRYFPILNPIDGAHICKLSPNHCELTGDAGVLEDVMRILSGQITATYLDPNCSLLGSAGAAQTESSASPASGMELVSTGEAALLDGEALTFPFHVDPTGLLVVNGVVDADEAILSLVDPLGTVIDPSSVSSFPNVLYEFGLQGTGRWYRYSVTDPMAGAWQFSLVTLVGGSSGLASAFASAFVDSKRTLEPGELIYDSKIGAAQTLTAKFEDDTQAIVGGTVTVEAIAPSGSTLQATLLDDGVTPDAAAGDGVYSGTAGPWNESGSHGVTFRALGTIASETVEREASAVLNVAVGGISILASVAESVSDEDADGLHDSLDLGFDLNVSIAGEYSLVASLSDSGGALVAQERADFAAQIAVPISVTVTFPGRTISAHGVDGPWVVSELVVMSRGDDALIEDAKVDWHATQAYLAIDFEPPDRDGDRAPDATDNCPNQNNPGQDDADGDGVGDQCDADLDGDGAAVDLDCSDYDATSTSAPPDLDLEYSNMMELRWLDAVPISGTGTVYDVVRGDLTDMAVSQGFGSAACLASGLTTNSIAETTTPPLGSGFFYLVRARNSCGQSLFTPDPSLTVSCP